MKKYFILAFVALSCSVCAQANVTESAKPERLRDRLINVEKTFVQHDRRMKKQDKEVASLVMRVKHLESILFEQGPIIIDGSGSKKSGRKYRDDNKKLKPYNYSGY